MGRKTAEQLTEGIDASHLTILVTGGTNGLGKETVRVLAKRGARVYLAARNLEAAYKVKEDILKETPHARIYLLRIDLASLESVRAAAKDFLGLNVPLHVLVCNAGIYAQTVEFTSDDTEIDFATNYLGHFLLAHLLLNKLKDTASESGVEGRIVNVTSEMYRVFPYKEGIRFDRIHRFNKTVVTEGPSLNASKNYSQSKLAQILYTKELAKRLKDEGVSNVTVNCVHPGLVRTNIAPRRRNIWSMAVLTLEYLFLGESIEQGAGLQTYLAISPDVKGETGKYFKKDKACQLKGKHAIDEELQKKLWDFSVKLVST